VLAASAGWLFIALLFPDTVFPNSAPQSLFKGFNSQEVHLRQVREHLIRIEPEWKRVYASRPEFSKVELSAYTGGDGMIAAFGSVPSEAAALAVSNFLQSTKPPRPIYLKALRIDDDSTNEFQPPAQSSTK
jgi:hypothetical protein